MKHTTAVSACRCGTRVLGQRILDHWQIYLLLLPAVIYFIIFYYWPMAGLQIAFRDYRVSKGIWGSTWVGLKYFQKFFQHPQCWKIIRNTMVISLYTLATFPLSIIMALLINELRGKKFQKTVQMVTYAPHFISTVVICSMITLFMNQSTGLFNNIIEMAGGKRVDFLGTAGISRTSSCGRACGRIWAGAPSSIWLPCPACRRSCMKRPIWTARTACRSSGT